MSQASLPRRPRPRLPFDLAAATFASRSSSACLALFGPFCALSSDFGAAAFAAAFAVALAGAARARTGRRARAALCFFAARALPAWDLRLRSFRAFCFLPADFFFFSFDLLDLRFCFAIRPPESAGLIQKLRRKSRRLYQKPEHSRPLIYSVLRGPTARILPT